MQKYRADKCRLQSDGAIVWTTWCHTLSKIENCLLAKLHGAPRRTVYITGEADSFFSIPAACWYAGKRIRGYVTGDDSGNIVFHHCYF